MGKGVDVVKRGTRDNHQKKTRRVAGLLFFAIMIEQIDHHPLNIRKILPASSGLGPSGSCLTLGCSARSCLTSNSFTRGRLAMTGFSQTERTAF